MSVSTLNFRTFPASTWRPSGVFPEFDASQANTATQNQRALLIGQILASGTATPNIPVLAYSQTQVNGLCGTNSMLALMYAFYRQQDPFGECWLLPLQDATTGAVAATGSIVFTGPATAAGVFPMYAMGVSVPFAVNVGDTAAMMATNCVAAFAATAGICASAAVDGVTTAKVDLTALHKGLALNDIDLRVAYIGPQNNEVVPAGVGYTITPFSGGATNPTLSAALANLGVQTFDFIAMPYTDPTSLAAIELFLSDQSGRWSAIEALYGHYFTAYRGTAGARGTFGTSRDSQHGSCLGFYDSPTPAWLEAADWAAVHAIRLRVNPAVGVTDMALGLLAPPKQSQDTPGERNTLLFSGISTFTVDAAGVCRIDRSITFYQTNASGQPDDSYLNTNLLFQAMFCARYIIAQLTSQFVSAGKILVANGTPIPLGSPATTPNLVFQAAVAIYAYLCSIFVAQNLQAFAQNGSGTSGQKGQVLLYLPFDFSDQVIQIAALIQFQQTT